VRDNPRHPKSPLEAPLPRILVLLLAVFVSSRPAIAQESSSSAPFVTTPDEVVAEMLALAGTGRDDYVIDLGSGDGRIVIAAARRFGARGLGVDLDEKLVAMSRENARDAGVAGRTEFRVQDALQTDLSGASVVTIYLLPQLIKELQPRVLGQMRPGSRVVTHAFYMQSWKPDAVRKVRLSQRHDRQGDESMIYLWIVPAQVRGAWQAEDWRLRIDQNFQEIEIEAQSGGRPLVVRNAKLRGDAIEFSGDGFAFSGRVAGDRIAGQMTRAGAALPIEFSRR
jgi:SAM-dependent methyltransferase